MDLILIYDDYMKRYRHPYLHISLSRTVPIRHHWIPRFESFILNLVQNMSPYKHCMNIGE